MSARSRRVGERPGLRPSGAAASVTSSGTRYPVSVTQITPFLWFDDQAEEALALYSSVFSNSEVVNVTKFDDADRPGRGFVMGTLRLENQTIMLFNGGPFHAFSEATSLLVSCEDQGEVDHYWSALANGGTPGRCGWLKDRFGLSWQIVPRLLGELMSDPDAERATRVRDTMLQMGKIDCAALQAAYDG